MTSISLPPEFNRDTHVESLRFKVRDPYWKSWLEYVVSNYRNYIAEAVNLAQQFNILSSSYSYNPTYFEILRKIYNYNLQFPTLAAYDPIQKRYLISIKNFYQWISNIYKSNPQSYLQIGNLELRHLAYHETGHMILDQYINKPTLSLGESIIHEAFAEFYSWIAAYATRDANFIDYVQRGYIGRAQLLFSNNPKFSSSEERSMARLLNFYLGDPQNYLSRHVSKIKQLEKEIKQLYKLLYSYKFSKTKDPRLLEEIRKKLTEVERALQQVTFFKEELGFLILEGQYNVIRKLFREIDKIYKEIEKIKKKEKPSFIDIIKFTFSSVKFFLTYRRYLKTLKRETEKYKGYGPQEAAAVIYRKFLYTPYGPRYMIALGGSRVITIRLPDIAHSVGFRLAYKWLQARYHPRQVAAYLAQNRDRLYILGYQELLDWINFIYNKYFYGNYGVF